MCFDFGPTLLEWMERHAPGTYAAVIAAGRRGGAVAMPYHHLILPLAPRRDKVTEVRWGIADFRRRFGREPEGMWLPETAVDDDTLDVLAAEGIRFTMLAPHQVERVPAGGLPGWYRTGGGRRIAVFTYDGAISHDVAFGPLVRDADAWVERLRSAGCTSAGARRCGRPWTGSQRSCALRSSATAGPCPASSSVTRCGCSRRVAGSSTTSPGSSR